MVVTLLIGSFTTLIVSASEDDEIKNNSNEYNCYAYAIGRFEGAKFYWPLDELFPRYQPNEIYKSYPNIYVSYNNDVYTLATLVQNDLLALGYTNIMIYQSADEDYKINDDEISTYGQMMSSINFETQELICLRIADETEYHFMRYDAETNA